MSYAVLTRCYNESPYINFFIEHYIKLGFDKIILLKSDNFYYKIPEEFKIKVELHNVVNEGNLIYHLNYSLYKNKYSWILFVDLDEFLFLNKNFKNIKDFVYQKLNVNKHINYFLFRWANINKLDNKNICDNLIFENYDLNQNNHIKCMINNNLLLKNNVSMCPHRIVTNCNRPIIYFENKIINKLLPFYEITNLSYKETVLIHVHTRSLNNLFIKSLNSYKNMCIDKHIKDKNGFITYINYLEFNKSKNIVLDFKNFIGQKVKLAYAKGKNVKLIGFKFYNYKYNLIDVSLETTILIYYLTFNKINYDKYKKFIDKLQLELNMCN